MTGDSAFRPVLPVAGDRAVHDLRIDRRDILVAKAEAAHDTRTELLHQDIGAFEQWLEALTIVPALEIENETGLAASELREQGHLPAAGALDRDDLGARFREKQRRQRPWQQRREIEDETAVKRLHLSSISTLRAMRNASTPAGMPA